MSNRRFGERGELPAPPRDFGNPRPKYVSGRGYGVILGIATVVGILLLGGLFYYSTQPDTEADMRASPSTTIGIAPSSDTRPGTPIPQSLPAGPRHDQ